MTTAEELAALQQEIRHRIIRSVADALGQLLDALPTGRPKHNQLLLLLSRAEEIRRWRIGNTRPPDQISIAENELREDILLFTDHLRLADFGDAPSVRPELRPGHLLYRVPQHMQLRQQHECLVRIAHTLEQVLEGLERDERMEIETVPVAEVMQVEIIDPSPPDARAFDILLVSDGEQVVDEYSYTEWVFYTRPLLPGTHNLVLKVSVLVTVKGKERTKNIVFRRRIDVQTEAVTAESALQQLIAVEPDPLPDRPPISPRIPMPTRGSGPKPSTTGGPKPSSTYSPPSPAPAPPPKEQYDLPRKSIRPLRRWLSVAASILVIAVAGWWVVNIGGSRYEQTPPGRTDEVIVSPSPEPDAGLPPLVDTLRTDSDTLEQ